jgi:hypothetical protein
MNLHSSLRNYKEHCAKAGAVLAFILLACAGGNCQDNPASLGIFEGQNDVGNVLHPGSAEYNSQTKAYVVSGSGENM